METCLFHPGRVVVNSSDKWHVPLREAWTLDVGVAIYSSLTGSISMRQSQNHHCQILIYLSSKKILCSPNGKSGASSLQIPQHRFAPQRSRLQVVKQVWRLQICIQIKLCWTEALWLIPCKSPPGEHCAEPAALLPSCIVISCDAFSLKELLCNAIGWL